MGRGGRERGKTETEKLDLFADVGDNVNQTVDSFNGPIDKLFNDLGQLQKGVCVCVCV